MPQCIVTDESHGRRAIFPATQRAVVLWALACVARSTGMILIQALRSRRGQRPNSSRRVPSSLRDSTLSISHRVGFRSDL